MIENLLKRASVRSFKKEKLYQICLENKNFDFITNKKEA